VQDRFARLAPAAPAARDVDLIADDVRRGDLRAAAARYAALAARPPALPPPLLFEVAKGAAQAGDYALAARALVAAARTLDPAVAPDALLILGRIYRSRLGRPDDARSVLQQLLARFPGSAAAAQARALLDPTTPPTPGG
jgi:TolA-binding protein